MAFIREVSPACGVRDPHASDPTADIPELKILCGFRAYLLLDSRTT